MKPTPGPWRALGGAIRPSSAKGYTGGYAPILIAKHDKRLPDNREANAKLAAAAPELLAALDWCLKQMPEPSLKGDYSQGWLAAKALSMSLEDDDRDARANRDEIGFVRAWLGEKK